ncbi:substrate-binding domain-containing protein [Sneathiella glossodoripedis]|uniref:substrate-binding domain-containing protein n=1 Tax=Sneathiella glossodoripedis TaxID=418853 RepID=UPI00068657DF|nr:substrate-binding domain-containing protein [Sneathiella glossodoripedis]
MLRILLIALCIAVSTVGSINSVSASRFEDYWTVEEFLSLNVEQVALSETFSIAVRKEARTTNSSNAVAKIAVVYPGLQVSDYWRRSIVSLEKRLQEAGQKYELITHFTKPGESVGEQGQKLGEFLAQEPDYLIFTLNVNRHKNVIRKLLARSSTQVILQNITTPLKEFSALQPFQYVGFDHALGTGLLVERYFELFPNGAEYAIFYGPKGYVSDMRGGTFLQAMQKNKNMVLKDSYFVGFNREKSREAALEVLKTHPNLKFIFSASTDIALGVIDAVEEMGLQGKVITNGWGGGSAELEALRSNKMTLTVMRMNDDNGVAMADAIVLAQSGLRIKSQQFTLVIWF